MGNNLNTIHPVTLSRPAKNLLCGGYTLESLWFEYFDEEFDSSLSLNIVPSISNMERIKTGVKELDLFKYPWDLITFNKKILNENLKYKISKNKYEQIQKNVYVGIDVKVGKNVVFESSEEKLIVIDNYSQIGSLSYLEGPIFIGKNTKVIDHASIKHNVCVGDTCKVGGEVEDSIISSYSNKQHYGFIGNSYIGEWVNLGAGTTNSDLKNTYGEISIDYQNQKIATGELFLGCVVCDYVKTAINTAIFTGKIIGVNTHIYGCVLSNVPSFVNYTQSIKEKNEEFRLEQAIKIQKKMFTRRNIEQTKKDIDVLVNVFSQTKECRDNFLN